MADNERSTLFDCTGLVAVVTGGGSGTVFYILSKLCAPVDSSLQGSVL